MDSTCAAVARSHEREMIRSGDDPREKVSCGETGVTRGEESRLKAGCSQDWLPHYFQRVSIGLAGSAAICKSAQWW